LLSDHRLTIQTPEQVTMELSPAGIGSRFLALALDTVIQFVGYILIVLLLAWLAPMVKLNWLSPSWAAGLAILLAFCIYWGYFAAFEILWHGQTPGKRVAGIRVVKDTGRPITAIEGVGRNLMRAVDGLFLYFVAMVSVLISRENKRLGDYLAGTIVIHEKKTAEVKPDWGLTAERTAPVRPELAYVSEQELVAIETFLHRRLDLDMMVRSSTALRLAQLVERKTGVAKPTDQSDEDFLETTARQVREQARLRT